jgi:hypothetical protein
MPPFWYTRLKQGHKDFIKETIGEATSWSQELEDKMMDNTGATRDDIQKLLIWWFSSEKVIYLIYLPAKIWEYKTTFIS